MSKPEGQEEAASEAAGEAAGEAATSRPAEAANGPEDGAVASDAGGERSEAELKVEEATEEAEGIEDAPGGASADEAAGAEAAPADGSPADGAEAPEEELPPLVPVLEAALFASAEAVPLTRLTRVLGAWSRKQVVAGLKELAERQESEGSGVRVVETAGGYQLRSLAEYAPWVRKFFAEKPPRLSRAVLETLAIVAYRQPATRGEVEAVRGVNCDAVLGALTARGLVQVIGRRQSPGRPVEYGTTHEFLELFSLKNLEELPPLPDPSSLANLIEEARSEEEAAEGEAQAGAAGEDIGTAENASRSEETTEATPDADDVSPVEPDGMSDGQEAAGDEEAGGSADLGEAAEDSESGGDRFAAFRGGSDSGGESSGQRESDPGARSES